MARQRKAFLTDVLTGETVEVLRGTPEYEQYKEQGYLSREQLSHREEYQPDIIGSPEEINTDYPEADDRELLKNKIEDMYSDITDAIYEIPDERTTYENHKANYIDLTDSKQMLLNMVDDLYAENDDDTANEHIKNVLPEILKYVEAIRYDSDGNNVEFYVTRIAHLLNNGRPLSFYQASTLGNADTFKGGYTGWYDVASRVTDRYV